MDQDGAGEGSEGPIQPDFEVWNHLDAGWQMAYDDLAQKLSPEMLSFLTSMAKIVVGAKSSLAVDPGDATLSRLVASVFPGLSLDQSGALLAGLLTAVASGRDPWLGHAVELELAQGGIARSTAALRRFKLLAPQIAQQPIPSRALPYVRETIDCFLFGFDAATIALCRSTLEQIAKQVLVERVGEYTWPQLRRVKPQPTLDSLVEKLKQSGALALSYDAAKRVKDRGNTVLHEHMYDEKIRRQMALDSVADLTAVLRELLP